MVSRKRSGRPRTESWVRRGMRREKRQAENFRRIGNLAGKQRECDPGKVKGRKISRKEWVKNVMRVMAGIVRMRLKGRTLDMTTSVGEFW